MVDLNEINSLLSIRNGVWATVLVCIVLAIRIGHILPGIMERWNERRRDRATIEAEQYERMDARLKHVEERHEECERRLDEERRQRREDVDSLNHELAHARGRIAELEGFMLGQGKARQDAANIIAIERLTDATKKGDDK